MEKEGPPSSAGAEGGKEGGREGGVVGAGGGTAKMAIRSELPEGMKKREFCARGGGDGGDRLTCREGWERVESDAHE